MSDDAQKSQKPSFDIACSFCSKTRKQVGMLIAAGTPGVYICDECAILVVFGPIAQCSNNKLEFILPDGEEKVVYSFGDKFLGAEYCPTCKSYNVEIGKPVDNKCIKCGAVFPIRQE